MIIPHGQHDQMVGKLFVICVLVALFVSGRITPATALVIPPLADPPSGSTLTSLSVTFTGTHTSDDLEHKLRIGTTNGGAQIYNKTMPPNHSVTVSGLPSMGTIYVWYWTRNSSGWFVNTSTYTMNVGRIWNCAAGDTACLINAITLANASGNPEVIQLAAGTYILPTLSSTNPGPLLPMIRGNIAIEGAGPQPTILRSNNRPQDTGISDFVTFDVDEGAILKLTGLSMMEVGTSIYNRGVVTLQKVTISDNQGVGAGIVNLKTGTVKMEHSTLTNISQGVLGSGTPIQNDGKMDIVESAIKSNRTGLVGAIFNSSTGVMTVQTTTIADNQVNESGAAGIKNFGNMELTKSLIQNNIGQGAPGIENRGEMQISKSVITGNESTEAGWDGGGIYNVGTLAISRTVIANNTVTSTGRGGGIYNQAHLSLDRTIIAGNQAGTDGGGIMNELNALLTLTETTVANNAPNDCAGCP
ncbi:MAG: hypothetical protein AB7F90_12950 [Nitrospirales bacterium]